MTYYNFSEKEALSIIEDELEKGVTEDLINRGIVLPNKDVRSYNIGKLDYSKHKIRPWNIWLEYNLNPLDADIIKRVLRVKYGDDRKLDYEKIIHICKERIRQLNESDNRINKTLG